ncbi:MAG TPA: VCBS repeat-containing protein, partial [Fimbriimonadaceae bacterium]|nr:VCBS repeat-containing protein [Fimbriimonadaceae bacterium]
MGFGPRFADFDNDGINDIISGSYTGGLSFFKGLGESRYAAMKKITQKDGKPVSKGYAQTPCMGDWDGDGDYDMALGVISGPVKLYLNNGDLTFTEAGDFTVNGKPITASDGGPCVVDWDGDGVLDLLLGDGQGSVDFYPGTGRGARELRAKETIIKADANGGWQPRKPSKNPAMPFTPAQPGVRT